MANDLIVPEILLVDKLQEMDNSLSPTVWDNMREDARNANDILCIKEKDMSPAIRNRRRMVMQDFVNRALERPMITKPEVNEETHKQLYRLHIFCCQRAIHSYEVRHNPFLLGFRALEEMRLALIAIMISARLVNPSWPYSMDKEFFKRNIITDISADNETIITFQRMTSEMINLGITDEIITDWMIYRAYDNNGIRTLMDVKNHLMTLPEYQRGGEPIMEFARFERKWREHTNKKKVAQTEALDLEFRKNLVKSVAEQLANNLLNSGLSNAEILDQAYNGDINKLVNAHDNAKQIVNSHYQNSTAHPQIENTSNSIEDATTNSIPALTYNNNQITTEDGLTPQRHILPRRYKKNQTKVTPLEDTEEIDKIIFDMLNE